MRIAWSASLKNARPDDEGENGDPRLVAVIGLELMPEALVVDQS